MQRAAFDRFLEIGENDRAIEVFHDLKANGKEVWCRPGW